MAKKKILKIELDNDFLLIGISSALNDYRLSWFLNRFQNIEISKQENFEFNVKDVNLKFNIYKGSINQNKELLLINNRNEESVQFLKIKSLDFFIKINDKNFDASELISYLREIPNVLSVFIIEPEKQTKQVQKIISNYIVCL